MKTFDKINLKKIREAMQSALEPVARQLEIAVRVGNCSFSPSNATFKVELSGTGEDGETITKESEDFKRYAVLFGLKPDDLGKTFKFNGDVATITGMKPKSRRFPVLARRRSDGRTFKYPADAVVRGLKE